ncbi:putative iron-regulated protein [Erwinia piriflorinigrans CFBP 5888]|uniref:Putative iron-regulated protein n=2 Tax=Erwinia piriflorinigrans TaxID=665097 RepID=V5ZA23_9GAMM|nr:putative iron-regulated protein [Erwinia piriflorinigrans CFBP 5888]
MPPVINRKTSILTAIEGYLRAKDMRKQLFFISLIVLANLGLCACNQSTHTLAYGQAAITYGQIIDLHSGQMLTDRQLLVKLASAPRLIVGEKHDNAEHHQIELWLIQNLSLERPQGSVLLEMLTASQQPRVTQVKNWLKEDPLVRDSRIQERLSWQKGWPWAMYGGVVSGVLRASYPLLNANINRDQVMSLYKNPRFPEGKNSTAPAVHAALKETIVVMHEGNIEGQQLTSMLAIQQQRDRYMAQQLLSAPPPALLIAGGYHASKSIGVPLHMKDLSPSSKPVVLMLAEKGMNITVQQADYLWFIAPATEKR